MAAQLKAVPRLKEPLQDDLIPDEKYLKNTADTKTSSAAPLCHTAVLSAFRAKEYILVLADSLQSCYHKMLLKNHFD